MAGGIYKIECDCENVYIGETGNKITKRIAQHKNDVRNMNLLNGIANHRLECVENIRWEDTTVLAYEQGWWRRKIKEGLYIQKNNPKINLNQGYNPKGNWN